MTFTFKLSPRSKHIKLRHCPFRGLIISAPRKLSQRKITTLLTQHKDWIETQQKHSISNTPLDDHIHLKAINEHYSIKVEKSGKSRIKTTDSELTLLAPDEQNAITILRQWIREKAGLFYAQRLDYWSAHTQLSYKKLSVRSQKSRWGSCSSNGTISLNDQLLFMPSSILDYIIIHELCHTVEANHLSRFWKLVATHYPDFRQQEQLLAQSVELIPAWFRKSLYS